MDGKHEMKRDPAAITSLSASTAAAPAARRAILQINPPEIGTRSEMTGFSRIKAPFIPGATPGIRYHTSKD